MFIILKSINAKFLVILLLGCPLLFIYSQNVPSAFTYSGIARNSQGHLLINKFVKIQLSILKGSFVGPVDYSEKHDILTDSFGFFNILIGAGAIINGSLNKIEWGKDEYYLKVGIDINGGNNFITLGVTQLLSVPYSIHSVTTEALVGNSLKGDFTHNIGEYYGGGIIFHLWRDSIGAEHGLIVDLVDINEEFVYSNIENWIGVPSKYSSWDGYRNSLAIVTQKGHFGSAADLCLTSTRKNYFDWYLPSIDELYLIWSNRFDINKSLEKIVEASPLKMFRAYWSSSEHSAEGAWLMSFIDGDVYANPKGLRYSVRAVRSF